MRANVEDVSAICRLQDNSNQQLQHNKSDRRFDLFMSLAIFCMISKTRSDTDLLHCDLNNVPRAFQKWPIDTLPSRGNDTQHSVADKA